MSKSNGDSTLPIHAGRFAAVVKTIHAHGSPAGFRLARDIMFEKFEILSRRMPPYALLKLAIEFDRHAMMGEVAAAKATDHYDQEKYETFQRYLSGEVEVAPAAGVPHGATRIRQDGVTLSVHEVDDAPDDTEEEDDR